MANLPDKSELIGNSVTESQFKQKLGILVDNVASKDYADTKKTEAITAATSAAASDAANRANTAETNAKNYADTVVQKTAQLNGWFDPTFQLLEFPNRSYLNRERFWNNVGGWSKVGNTVYGGLALRRADGYNQTSFGGFITWLDELNIGTGDAISAYVQCVGNASVVYAVAVFQNDAGSNIGTANLMTTLSGSNPLTTSLTEARSLRISLTVPSGATRLVVYPYNFSGSVGFDVVAHWTAKGDLSKVSTFPVYDSVKENLLVKNTQKTQPYLIYKSVLDGENIGNSTYSYGMGGFYETVAASAKLNTIRCRVWKTIPSDVEVKIYVREPGDSLSFTPSSVAANQQFTIPAAKFPTIEQDLTIRIDTPLDVAVGQRVVVLFKATDGGNLSVKRWLYDATVTPARRGFPFSTSSDWSAALALSGASIGYGQTAMMLSYETGEFEDKAKAENILYGSVTVKSALDQLTAASPTIELIVPPKIFATQGFEANLYFDNLLAQSSLDYQFDVSAGVGTQQQSRWTLVPTGGNSSTLTIAAYSKSGVLLTSKTIALVATASSDNAGTKKVCVIGDSLVGAGVITQTLLDNSTSNVTKVALIGTQGTGSNKHEGRGGAGVSNYTSAGVTYYAFTVSGITTEPLINATEYTHNGSTYRVQTVSLSGGSGTIICSVVSGGAPLSSGTLTKSNAIQGDATISFTASAAQSGNPFWFSGAVNFSQYLTANSFDTPDVVAIMLGINDVFAQSSDASASSLADSKLSSLDTLIASIKAVNSSIKVALMIPPPPAGQDAFGKNYASGETAWRHKRNIVIWARQMIAKYSNQESNRIYLVPVNVAIDTLNNYPTETVAINSRNSAVVTRQSNGVHPATSGYQQIGDSLFAFLKSF